MTNSRFVSVLAQLLTVSFVSACLWSTDGLADDNASLDRYMLGENDVVEIDVLNEPTLSSKYSVSSEGYVRFPLIGDVEAKGKTRNELKELLEERLKGRFLKNPQLSVEIVEYRRYFISGAIKKPGAYPYLESLTLRKAMIIAGGKEATAGKSITIVDAKGKSSVVNDLETLVSPGDVVSVPIVAGCLECMTLIGGNKPHFRFSDRSYGIIVGESVAYPEVGLSLAYDDNIFDTSTDTEGSWVTVLAPKISWQGGSPLWGYQFDYTGEYGRFHNSSDDDFADHAVAAQTALAVSASGEVLATGLIRLGHDRRGTALSEGRPNLRDVPDRWRQTEIGAIYEFDNDSGGLGLSLGAKYFSKEYLNNREFTELRDRNETILTVRPSYTLRSMLDIFARASYRDVRYDFQKTLDSEVIDFGLGIEYEVDQRLVAMIRAGRSKRKFKDTDEETTEPSYVGSLEWRLSESHIIEAELKRETKEAVIAGEEFRITNIGSLSWTARYSPWFSTQISGSYGEEEIENRTGNRRKDLLYDFTIRLSYFFNHWLTGGIVYEHSERDSDDDFSSYTKNVIGLSAVASF